MGTSSIGSLKVTCNVLNPYMRRNRCFIERLHPKLQEELQTCLDVQSWSSSITYRSMGGEKSSAQRRPEIAKYNHAIIQQLHLRLATTGWFFPEQIPPSAQVLGRNPPPCTAMDCVQSSDRTIHQLLHTILQVLNAASTSGSFAQSEKWSSSPTDPTYHLSHPIVFAGTDSSMTFLRRCYNIALTLLPSSRHILLAASDNQTLLFHQD